MRRNISIILALVLVFVLSASAGAGTITQSTPGGTGNTTIEYIVPQTYTVYIEDVVTLQDGTKTSGVSVYSPLRIPYGKSLKVSISAASYYGGNPPGFRLKDEDNDIFISYTIEKSQNPTNESVYKDTPFLIVAANEGSASATLIFTADEPRFAGTYKDILTFKVEVN